MVSAITDFDRLCSDPEMVRFAYDGCAKMA